MEAHRLRRDSPEGSPRRSKEATPTKSHGESEGESMGESDGESMGESEGESDYVNVPSLMELAAPHCVDGAVASLEREITQISRERLALKGQEQKLTQEISSQRAQTQKLVRAVHPRKPPPPPDDVQAVSAAALAEAMPTPSLSEAAAGAQLTASQLWTILHETIADNEMLAEKARIQERGSAEEEVLVQKLKAIRVTRAELAEQLPVLRQRVKQTRIEVALQVHCLLRTRELPSEATHAAVASHQEWLDGARRAELPMRTGKAKGELGAMECPLCKSRMHVHALDRPAAEASPATSSSQTQQSAQPPQRPALRCGNPDCEACGFTFLLPGFLRWCHSRDMRERSAVDERDIKKVTARCEGGSLVLSPFQLFSWGVPPKESRFTLPACTSLFVAPGTVPEAAHCMTCKFHAGFSYESEDEWFDGSFDEHDDDDPQHASSSRQVSKSGVAKKCRECRVRGGHAPGCQLSPENLPMFCADCREFGKAFLYCGSSRCGAGPLCSVAAGRPIKKYDDVCGLQPCSKCSALRCWNCYEESPGGEMGECTRCGRASERRYEREAAREERALARTFHGYR